MDFAWKYVGNKGFTYSGFWWQAFDISLVFNAAGQPYVAFTDWNNSGKATVMKFDGTNWVKLGNAGFSAGEAHFISLALDSNGDPFVAFSDYGNAEKATVMKFDGLNWVTIGNAGFSSGGAWYTSLSFGPDDLPYVAFGDDGNSTKATVMKFESSNWSYVGNAGFSAGMANCTSLAFSPSGQPYVAYQDHVTGFNTATVMKFDGTNWAYVGNPGFSAGSVEWTTIAFNPDDGVPYVSYVDLAWTTYYKATVMKFTEPDWVYVGNAGFSAAEVGYPRLAFSPAGEPFVAYIDVANFYRATVMKFNGTSWVNVGIPGFSEGGEVWENSLAVSSTGVPYLAFKECNSDSCVINVMKYDSVLVGNDELKETGFSIYPNPATDKITIETSGLQNESIITIVNPAGQQVLQKKVTVPRMQIDVNWLPSGIYFLKLTKERSVQVAKFVKN